MKEIAHIDYDGKVKIVDVSYKRKQLRTAKARGRIKLQEQTIHLITENKITKGNVLTIAQIAGIQSAKKTSEIIPLCHPLQITNVTLDTQIEKNGICVFSEVSCIGQTGVEMEALTAVSVALLTIYDMCKGVDKTMEITDISLIEKAKKTIRG